MVAFSPDLSTFELVIFVFMTLPYKCLSFVTKSSFIDTHMKYT